LNLRGRNSNRCNSKDNSLECMHAC
jgi:hypothetical protein